MRMHSKSLARTIRLLTLISFFHFSGINNGLTVMTAHFNIDTQASKDLGNFSGGIL